MDHYAHLRPFASAKQLETIDAIQAHGTTRKAAEALGITQRAVMYRLKSVRLASKAGDFNAETPPAELQSVEELIEERKRKFALKDAHMRASHLIDVRVALDGPIGIAHFGDPHLDDNGTDLGLIERHMELVNKTEGLLAANIGDTINNWMGRLARLYGEQSTSAEEAWQLAEWFIRGMEWLYFLDGNHGAWSGAGDPVKWILSGSGVHGGTSARLNLKFPNGNAVRINARHDFKGHSQWNTAHGPAKAAQMGWRDHILICGHLHTSGYQILKDPSTGLLSHAIRIASYKTHDRYAIGLGLPDQNISPLVLTVINPYAENQSGLVTVFHDPERGADYLCWLRDQFRQS